MDVIAHWSRPECPNGHPPPLIDRGRGYRCEHCDTPPVWVPMVVLRAADYAGAVEALERIANLRAEANAQTPRTWGATWATKATKIARDALRGQ